MKPLPRRYRGETRGDKCADTARTEARRRWALEARREGRPMRWVALVLGVSRQRAWQIANQAERDEQAGEAEARRYMAYLYSL